MAGGEWNAWCEAEEARMREAATMAGGDDNDDAQQADRHTRMRLRLQQD